MEGKMDVVPPCLKLCRVCQRHPGFLSCYGKLLGTLTRPGSTCRPKQALIVPRRHYNPSAPCSSRHCISWETEFVKAI